MSEDILNNIIAGDGCIVTHRYGYGHMVMVSVVSEVGALPMTVKSHAIILDGMLDKISDLETQVETLNKALEKMDAELCKYKPALEVGMMYVAKQEFDEALKRM